MLISYYHDKPRHERVVLVTEKVLVQARLPAALVRELDELLKEGYYRDRTEAISDAIRRLIETFSKRDRISKTVRL
ncbi:MAG: ribbon-helix-helix domain-containing protein, partial [Candidatus Baldrarchaeia archaeon]